MSSAAGSKSAIAIIGTGFAGIGMAIRLKQAGRSDFIMFERSASVGGTWRDQTYPGCAVDVEAILYSFSFAPSAAFSRMYAPQAEILAYLRWCVAKFGLEPHIRLNHEVVRSQWDEADKVWRLETSQGAFSASFLVSAVGLLSAPVMPQLKGLAQFQGKVMHSARWDHTYAFAGKRVAVIGTGASAIQIVPQLQPQVASLTLLQRTPAWVVPRSERLLGPRLQALLRRFPLVQRLWRQVIYCQREVFGFGFRHPRLQSAARRMALSHIRRGVSNPELRRKLTPAYTVGCKRVLISNDYYPAVAAANVEVQTSPVAELREHALVTADGRQYELDAVIFCTGFHVTDAPYMKAIIGALGRSLQEVWQGLPRAFLGTTVAGFPNLFLLHGPNTGLGHSSVVLMMEAQIEHILGALRHLDEVHARSLEPQLAAQQAFNHELGRRSKQTVWLSGGCSSYYLDRSGANASLWPRGVGSFRRQVQGFRPSDYHVAE